MLDRAPPHDRRIAPGRRARRPAPAARRRALCRLRGDRARAARRLPRRRRHSGPGSVGADTARCRCGRCRRERTDRPRRLRRRGRRRAPVAPPAPPPRAASAARVPGGSAARPESRGSRRYSVSVLAPLLIPEAADEPAAAALAAGAASSRGRPPLGQAGPPGRRPRRASPSANAARRAPAAPRRRRRPPPTYRTRLPPPATLHYQVGAARCAATARSAGSRTATATASSSRPASPG